MYSVCVYNFGDIAFYACSKREGYNFSLFYRALEDSTKKDMKLNALALLAGRDADVRRIKKPEFTAEMLTAGVLGNTDMVYYYTQDDYLTKADTARLLNFSGGYITQLIANGSLTTKDGRILVSEALGKFGAR